MPADTKTEEQPADDYQQTMNKDRINRLGEQFNYWIRDPFWGGIDYIVHYGLRCLQLEQVSAIGKYLGILAGRYRFNWLNERMLRTVRLIKPDITETELTGFTDRVWENMGRTLAEMSVADRVDMDRIQLLDGQHFFNHVDSGQPVIFLFAHLGNWEMIARCAQLHGYKLNVVYELLQNRFQRKLAEHARERVGYAQIQPDLEGVKQIYQSLKNGEYIGLAMDEYKNNTVMAPAFGRKIEGRNNIEYALGLAKQFDAIIIPVHCLRKNGTYFDIHLSPPIFVGDYRDEEAEQKTIRYINDLCESWIKQNPDQWYMLHRYYP